jgi:hypothetical protein
MNISEHFTLEELTRTDVQSMQAENYRLAGGDNKILHALRSGALSLLEPIRANYASPVVIHSAYRCPDLNDIISREKDPARRASSQHLLGEAFDFHVVGASLFAVFNWIRNESDLPFGQVILEGSPPRWIHVSLGEPFRPANKCRQAIVYTANADGSFSYKMAAP